MGKVCTKHDMTCANIMESGSSLRTRTPSVDKLRSIHSDKKFISTLTFDLTHWKQPWWGWWQPVIDRHQSCAIEKGWNSWEWYQPHLNDINPISLRLRDGWHHQNGLIFGKIPNGLWPPPSFSENYIADFATKVRMFIMAGLLCIIWSYFPWDACS